MKNDIEAARKMHEELQTNTEEILQDLKLPYKKFKCVQEKWVNPI
jgi:seryl-tRNA synthetase